MRKRAFIGMAVAAVAGLSALLPTAASAASSATCNGGSLSPCTASTSVSFSIASGSLNLSVPASVDFTTSPFSPTATSLTFSPTWPSGSPITVTDNRTTSLGWTDTVTALPTWQGSGSNTMVTGTSTFDVTGSCGTVTNATLTPLPVTLASGGVLMSAVATGVNTVSCVPKLTIVVPPTATADTYTGTITQTVA